MKLLNLVEVNVKWIYSPRYAVTVRSRVNRGFRIQMCWTYFGAVALANKCALAFDWNVLDYFDVEIYDNRRKETTHVRVKEKVKLVTYYVK